MGSYANELHKVVDIPDIGKRPYILPLYTYYDYRKQRAQSIVSDVVIEDSNYSVFNIEEKQQQQQPRRTNIHPTKPSLLKLTNGDIVLYIPYSKLIKITSDHSTR